MNRQGARSGTAPGGPRDDTEQIRRDWVARLGEQIRERRTGQYTVEELANRAGVSSGLISQLERGFGNPSFETLLRLAHALDTPLQSFFQTPDGGTDRLVVRRELRRRLEMPDEGMVWELLTPDVNRKLAMMRTVLPAGYDNSDKPLTHAGEECIFVLKGELHGCVGGSEFVLREGDSATYDSSLPHWWQNRGSSEVEFLGAMTPPSL